MIAFLPNSAENIASNQNTERTLNNFFAVFLGILEEEKT